MLYLIVKNVILDSKNEISTDVYYKVQTLMIFVDMTLLIQNIARKTYLIT